jgi:hypothetical protein
MLNGGELELQEFVIYGRLPIRISNALLLDFLESSLKMNSCRWDCNDR